MKIFVLLLNVIGFWLLADPAHAGPVLAIPALLSSLGAVGSFVAKVLLTVALNLASTLLQRMTAKKQKQQAVGVKLEIQMGDDLPVSTTIGRYATAGKRKYAGTYGDIGGTPNAMFVDVIELGNMPVSGLQGLWIDDEKCTIMWDEETSRGFPIYQFQGALSKDHHAWIKFYDGTQTQPNAYLRARFGDHPNRPFLDTMIGRGCPYAVMTFRFNRDMFGGAPTCVFELGPLKLYDIRKDSSAGGNGPHRWNAPSTWEPSTNLPVMIYNIIRGLKYNDQWMFGGQDLAASRLPASNWIAAAQEASRLIRITDQPSEPQFRGGYEITGDMEPLDVIDDLRAGCAARLAENGGSFKIHVGAFAAAVFAISDDDIIVTEDQSFEPFPGLDATVNAIKASYPEPDEKWASKDAPTLYRPSLEIEDGNRVLPADVQLPAVPYKRQVQRLMRMMIEEERRFRTHQFYLPPQAWVLEPNDVISWTSERNGYENKKFVILAIEGEMTLNQLVTIKEIDPADYDWSPEFELPTSEGWMGRIEAPVQEMDGWSVSPASINDNAGNPRRVAIKIECADGLDDVMKVWVQVRNSATGDVVFDSDQTPYADPYEWLLSGDWCLPLTAYQARGKYVPFTARKTNWSEWLPVITFDTRMSFDDLTDEVQASLEKLREWISVNLAGQVDENTAALLAEVQARAEAIAKEQSERLTGAIEASQRYRLLLNDVAAIRDYALEGINLAFAQKEEVRQVLTQQLHTMHAEFDQRITVAIGNSAAVVQRVTSLEVRTDDAEASMVRIETASIDRYQAIANDLSQLVVGTNTQFDPVNDWHFDGDAEGWSGNGGPSVANGCLRPANQAGDAYVTSPAGLGINANRYRQVRLRIKRTGAPVWEGLCWWKSSTESGWQSGRSVAANEPLFDARGFGFVTFDMPWQGTIDQIRLDLSSAQTATSYFELDWVSIGSPSPGASRAALMAETSARASGDQAIAQSVEALRAELVDVDGNVEALAEGVSVITTTVETLDDRVTAQGESLTSVAAKVEDKADAEALNELSAEVEALGGGGVVSQGEALTGLRNTLLALSDLVLEQGNAGFVGQQAIRGALTEASQRLSTRIELNDKGLTLLSEAVTQVRAELPSFAKGEALNSLTARVTSTEDGLESFAEAITQVKASIDDKADGGALLSLTQTVQQQGGTLTSQGDAILSVQNGLNGKANAEALLTLTNEVNLQGSEIDVLSAALLSVDAELDGKASAQALLELNGAVAEQGGVISATSAALLQLSATLGTVTADLRFKMEVVPGPAGFVTLGARGRIDTASSYREAGFYLNIPYDPANPTEFLVDAQRFGLMANGVPSKVFIVEGNRAYIDNAFIRNLSTNRIQFEDGSVLESAVAKNAVAERRFFSSISVENPGVNLISIGSVQIDKNSDDYHEVDAVVRCEHNGQIGQPASIEIRLRHGSNEVDTQVLTFADRGELQVAKLKYMLDSGSGIRTYSIVARTLTGTVYVGRRTLAAKRDKKSNA